MRKLSEVELEREELSTKVNEANQSIGALRFENNLLVEKTKKLDIELFQVRAQLERILCSKLNEMLNFQNSTSDKTSLRYDHSLSSCSTSSNALNRVIFAPLANNDNSEVTDPKIENVSEDKSNKGKYILGAPLRFTNNKSQPKKPHFCHYYAASGHTRPNCCKWLATQHGNSVLSFGNQNQIQLSLAPFGELLKAVMLLFNINGFNSLPYPSKQRFVQKKGFPSRFPI